MEEVTTPDPIVEIALPDPEPVVQPTVPDEVKTQELSPSNPPHVDNSQEGDYFLSDIEIQKTVSEKSLEDYIFKNINRLWKEIFNETVIKVTRQYSEIVGFIQMGKDKIMPKRGARADLYIECEGGNNYLVEIKNPKYGQFDTINAIGKILMYSTIFKEANKLVILSTLYEPIFKEIITRYNLPIEFVLFGKDKVFLLKK